MAVVIPAALNPAASFTFAQTVLKLVARRVASVGWGLPNGKTYNAELVVPNFFRNYSPATERAKEYARAPSTLRAYRVDLADFTAWCSTQNLCPPSR